MNTRIRQFFVCVIVFGALSVGFSTAAEAAETLSSVHLDQPTLEKGYTISDPAGAMKVGVMPGSIHQPATVTVKAFNAEELPLPAERLLVSAIYEYDVLADVPPASLQRPVAISLAFTSDNYRPKSVYYYNKPTQSWVSLPGTVQWNTGRVQAASLLPYSILAVLEEAEPKHAPMNVQYTLAEATLGQTVQFDDQTVWIEMVDDTLKQATAIELKDAVAPPAPEGFFRVSPAYVYDFHGSVPAKAFRLKLAYESPNPFACT